MVTEFSQHANQKYNTPFLFPKQRAFQAGNVKVRITDVLIEQLHAYGTDGGRNRVEFIFNSVKIDVAVYARKLGNKILPSPQRIGGKTITKYWGVNPGDITICSVPSSGLYSLKFTVHGAEKNGLMPHNDPIYGIPGTESPDTDVTFDIYHH